jgi:hypothetical protein
MRRLALLALLAVAACHQAEPSPTPEATPTASEAPPATAEATPAPAPTEAPAAPATATTPPLDAAALNEHKDPDRLLAYLSEAIDAGRWADAAKAWQDGTGGAGVKKLFGSPAAPLVTFGKGDEEGAAGSLYYAAPILLLDGGKRQKEGTITLRRVNDVPGASAASLAWHVERVEWKN